VSKLAANGIGTKGNEGSSPRDVGRLHLKEEDVKVKE